jgi:hypothetical protein
MLEIGIGSFRIKSLGNIFDKCSQIVACVDDVG